MPALWSMLKRDRPGRAGAAGRIPFAPARSAALAGSGRRARPPPTRRTSRNQEILLVDGNGNYTSTRLGQSVSNGHGCYLKPMSTERWRELFLRSADIYMATRPQDRADLLIAGRGAVSRLGQELAAPGRRRNSITLQQIRCGWLAGKLGDNAGRVELSQTYPAPFLAAPSFSSPLDPILHLGSTPLLVARRLDPWVRLLRKRKDCRGKPGNDVG
jgi:hypothetical protein